MKQLIYCVDSPRLELLFQHFPKETLYTCTFLLKRIYFDKTTDAILSNKSKTKILAIKDNVDII